MRSLEVSVLSNIYIYDRCGWLVDKVEHNAAGGLASTFPLALTLLVYLQQIRLLC